MDYFILLLLPIVLAQVEGISWVDIAQSLLIALAVLLGTKFLTPSINRTDDAIKRSEERLQDRIKGIEERLLRAEKERDDLQKENNELWKKYNLLDKEQGTLGEKQFNLGKFVSAVKMDCEKTTNGLEKRIDDFRSFLTNK